MGREALEVREQPLANSQQENKDVNPTSEEVNSANTTELANGPSEEDSWISASTAEQRFQLTKEKICSLAPLRPGIWHEAVRNLKKKHVSALRKGPEVEGWGLSDLCCTFLLLLFCITYLY